MVDLFAKYPDATRFQLERAVKADFVDDEVRELLRVELSKLADIKLTEASELLGMAAKVADRQPYEVEILGRAREEIGPLTGRTPVAPEL